MNAPPETLRMAEGALHLIDQTLLPGRVETLACHTVAQTHDAIRRLVVRGAPAIGIAAAYGVCLAKDESGKFSRAAALAAAEYLATSRPTAVNLFWALDRMRAVLAHETVEGEALRDRLLEEARRIHEEDRRMCRQIGANGAPLLAACSNVLTHCNAGGLAASTWGTALAPIYHLQQHGKTLHVFADETRPLLQGARLTAWELGQAGVPVTVCTDSMAGSLMQLGRVDAVIVGADRIAANGDVANKIGTYPLAIVARYHGVPFYVAAPTNTFDLELPSGDRIPIEQRDGSEVARTRGDVNVPPSAEVTNPAFDVTPASLITGIITERGVILAPDAGSVEKHFRA